MIARYARRDLKRFFRADAAWAVPAIHARPEEAGCFHAIRLPFNAALREKIAHRMARPVERPSPTKVRRLYEDFLYQAASRDTPRRVIARIGRLYRHRRGDGARRGGTVPQPARHRRAAPQGGKPRLAPDAAALQAVPP